MNIPRPAEVDLVRAFLQKGEGDYLSGEALSRGLNISRAALWKRMNSLRERGFVFKARRGSGYSLVETPDLSSTEIMARVSGPIGGTVYFYDSLGSTNDRAMELAADGAPHGTVVVAERQSSGRGRLGRKWVSPGGRNLYLSIILRPSVDPRGAGMLPLVCAVAVADALKEATELAPRIKWPNDIQISGRKAGGILCEMRSEPGSVLYAIAGIGVNINSTASSFPEDLREIATSVYLETGKKHKRAALAISVLKAFSVWYERWLREGSVPVAAAWRGYSSTIGRRVRVSAPAGDVSGTALDIDADGSLLIETSHAHIQAISTGDVELLR